MSSNKINTKTISRIAAIQTLYQYQQETQVQDIDPLIQNMLKFYGDKELNNDYELTASKSIKIKPSISYFIELVKSTVENLKFLDEIIVNHLIEDWKIADLPPLLLALLRVAICELKFFPNSPKKVIINEFTDITSDMLSDNEIGFVNSILDKIAKA